MKIGMISKAIANKALVIVLHVCGWALLFMLPFRFLSRGPLFVRDRVLSSPQFREEKLIQAVPLDPSWIKAETILTNSLLAVFFYTNMFVLVPKVLSKRGWAPYGILVSVVFVLYLVTGYVFRVHYLNPLGLQFGPPFFIGIPNFLMVFGLSLALKLMQDRSTYETVLKERENEKLKSELSFLRSQVSPHFMFNVLNSLASLARKKSDQVESAVIQLSQLMRYSLYHTDKKVTLEQEADYINNYKNLQKLRFGSTVNMHFHVDLERKDLLIEPMLLVPFVENAFKHGVGLIGDPVIIIILEASSYRISFTVRNKFNPAYNEVKDSSSGIGLHNVRRRLDLLYKDLYTLDTYTTETHWFVAELKLIPE
jgi:two-component system LytT family sensor kinase